MDEINFQKKGNGQWRDKAEGPKKKKKAEDFLNNCQNNWEILRKLFVKYFPGGQRNQNWVFRTILTPF